MPEYLHGTYIGKFPLVGKTALLQNVPKRPDKLLAQLDDTTTILGYGWSMFDRNEFKMDKPIDWSMYNEID